MWFTSDNAAGAPPEVMKAVADAATGYGMAYGADPWTEKARAAIREAFEAPDASVHFVATGTGANSLALACLNWLSMVIAGYPWSITWAFTLAGAKIATLVGWDPAGVWFWTGGFTERALNSPILTDDTFVDALSGNAGFSGVSVTVEAAAS